MIKKANMFVLAGGVAVLALMAGMADAGPRLATPTVLGNDAQTGMAGAPVLRVSDTTDAEEGEDGAEEGDAGGDDEGVSDPGDDEGVSEPGDDDGGCVNCGVEVEDGTAVNTSVPERRESRGAPTARVAEDRDPECKRVIGRSERPAHCG
jgi:hypothetical protein